MWKVEKTVSKGDYLYAVVKDHPAANQSGYVLAHRVVMENYLGRLLSPNEVVHHKNGNGKDNRIENLDVVDWREHSRQHGFARGRKMCVLRCPSCEIEFVKPKNATFLQKPTEYTCCSRSCRGKFSRKVQLEGKTAEVERAISGNLVAEFIRIAADNPEETI